MELATGLTIRSAVESATESMIGPRVGAPAGWETAADRVGIPSVGVGVSGRETLMEIAVLAREVYEVVKVPIALV